MSQWNIYAAECNDSWHNQFNAKQTRFFAFHQENHLFPVSVFEFVYILFLRN